MKFDFVKKTTLDEEVGRLWEMLRMYHEEVSTCFEEYFNTQNWDKRKETLEAKYNGGTLFIVIVVDTEIKENIGYIISGVHRNGNGEIESLYLKEAYRKSGLGTILMEKALAWLQENGVKEEMIVVATGNEQAYPFYKRFGFYPKYTTLIKKN